MKKIRCFFLICTLFPALAIDVSIAQNKSAQSSGTETVDLILKKLSVEEKLDEFTREVKQEFSQNPFGLTAEQNKQMMDHFSNAFLTDSLLSGTRQEFNRQYEQDYAASVVQWMNREKTAPVFEAQKKFYTIQGIRKRIISRYELEQDPPADERIEVIRNLLRRNAIAETEMETSVIVFRTLVQAFSKLSDQQNFSEQQIEGFVSNYRNQIKNEIDREVTNQLLIKYHDIDSEVIRDYSAFYNTEAGNWLVNTVSESILSAYRSASDRFLKSLGV